MAKKPLEVVVSPTVLQWARESAGWSVEDAAAQLKLDAQVLKGWESGERRPPFAALVSMADEYKRPVAALLLPEPPQEPPPPADFRSLPGQKGRLASDTLLAIRRARRLQGLAGEIMRGFGRPTTTHIAAASLLDDPESIASVERAGLGVSIDEQLGWQNPHGALRRWRASLERENALVFQFTMPLEDCRGFSLADQEPFALVINSSDAIRARIFTLFHEYGHLLLKTPGVCLPELTERHADNLTASAERWCNRFAAALLVPLDALMFPGSRPASGGALGEVVNEESRRLKVSQEVILRRMLDLGAIGRREFDTILQRLRADQRQPKRTGGFVSPVRRAVAERGRLFSSLVLDGLQAGVITYADAADYLSLRLKHLGDVQSLLAA